MGKKVKDGRKPNGHWNDFEDIQKVLLPTLQRTTTNAVKRRNEENRKQSENMSQPLTKGLKVD